MKRICYVTTISLTIRSFFIPQLKFLSENGFDVTVICSPDDDLGKELGDKIKYIPVRIARGVSPFTLNKTIKELTELFKENNFDLVQYSTPNAAFCAAIAAKRAGVRIRNYHLMGLRYLGLSEPARSVFKTLEKLSCKLSTHIECITPSNLELSVKEGLFPREKAVIVGKGSTGGVELERFDHRMRYQWRKDIRERYSIKDNDFVFGFAGRITKDKGINELLEAYNGLSTGSKLMIVGGKEGIDTLDPQLWNEACRNDNIIIIDNVSDIERYYAAMDIIVLPSYREGFGMVIAEAAAIGTPAIVSNIPGPTDVIEEGSTGFAIEVKNVSALAERMRYCLDNTDEVKRMSQRCVQFIKDHFDSNVLNEKVLERKLDLLTRER